MHCVRVAARAVLLELDAVRVVATVLASDVVAVLALLAGQSDLRSQVVLSQWSASFVSFVTPM